MVRPSIPQFSPLSRPRRGPFAWSLALLCSAGLWWVLLAGASGPGGGVGLMFAGGWTLSLMPIHSSRRPVLRSRSSVAQSQPPGGGVEPAVLEGGAEG